MRKITLIIFLLTLLFSCNKSSDLLIAEAFHHKLFLSEVMKQLPSATSKEDSLLFIEQYVNDWIVRKTLLVEAKKELSQKEQDFSSQIEQYKEQLLIDFYLQKLSNHPSIYNVSNSELAEFLNETKTEESPEYRDMIKLNYIKLSEHSKVYKTIKNLFFEEQDRVKGLQQLEKICSDTIEYYLDSEHWFYNDFIERELSFPISNNNNLEKLDFVQDGYRFLVLILDRKQQMQTKDVREDRKIAQVLLQQQKRTTYLSNYQDSVVHKALTERKVVKYPVGF